MGATLHPVFQRESMIWQSILTANEKLLLLCLNSFLGADGRCFPSIATMSRMTGLSRSTTNRTLALLEDQAIINSQQRYRDDGSQTASDRFLDFDAIPMAKPDPDPAENQGGGVCQNDMGVCQDDMGVCHSETGGVSDWEGGGVSLTHQELSRRTIQKNYLDLFPPTPRSEKKGKKETSKLDPERTVAPPAAAPVAAVDPSKPDPFAAQFAPRPWRENGWGKILPKFCEFMVAGKHIVVDGQMNPKTKAMYHVSNLERDGKWDKLEYLWAEYQASLQPARPKAKLATESYDERVRREMNQHQQREHA
jgi:hypothetical protein